MNKKENRKLVLWIRYSCLVLFPVFFFPVLFPGQVSGFCFPVWRPCEYLAPGQFSLYLLAYTCQPNCQKISQLEEYNESLHTTPFFYPNQNYNISATLKIDDQINYGVSQNFEATALAPNDGSCKNGIAGYLWRTGWFRPCTNQCYKFYHFDKDIGNCEPNICTCETQDAKWQSDNLIEFNENWNREKYKNFNCEDSVKIPLYNFCEEHGTVECRIDECTDRQDEFKTWDPTTKTCRPDTKAKNYCENGLAVPKDMTRNDSNREMMQFDTDTSRIREYYVYPTPSPEDRTCPSALKSKDKFLDHFSSKKHYSYFYANPQHLFCNSCNQGYSFNHREVSE